MMFKKIIIVTLIPIAALIMLPLRAQSTFPQNTQTVVLSIPGMTCPVCPITIKKALDNMAGVNEVSIDFKTKRATVVFNPNQVQIADLTAATKNAGYPSLVEKDH
ncbi:TPA: cation transporter [Legionella anisa]